MPKIGTPRVAGIGRSVEVQQGRKGLALMLRRGLHGAKNWVLEPDEDGTPSSAWVKAGKTAAILLPVWIVLSAVTGGPERGGQQPSLPKALVTAMLATLIGLAVLSARERRHGREEPWLDLPKADAESGVIEAETKVDPAPEAPTVVMEKAQVSESEAGVQHITASDNPGNHGHSSRNEADMLQEPVHESGQAEGSVQVSRPFDVLHDLVHAPSGQGANQEETTSPAEVRRQDEIEKPLISLRKDSPNRPSAQVSTYGEVLRNTTGPAAPDWANVDTTGSAESDETLIEDEPTRPLRPALHEPVHEAPSAPGSAQVTVDSGLLRDPVQGELQVLLATPGPYPVSQDPVTDDWWRVKPDEPTAEEENEEDEEPETAPSATPEEEPEAALEQPGQSGQGDRLPGAVRDFLATQGNPALFTAEQKEEAHTRVVEWLRREIEADRVSRAHAARMLGVNRSTVGRWLNDDPWEG